MAIQSRFALLLTLCLFATSGLAAPVPGAPAVNPDTNELVGQNTITALGKPVNVPRAGLSAASLPFLINPDTLPVAPAHGAGSYVFHDLPLVLLTRLKPDLISL